MQDVVSGAMSGLSAYIGWNTPAKDSGSGDKQINQIIKEKDPEITSNNSHTKHKEIELQKSENLDGSIPDHTEEVFGQESVMCKRATDEPNKALSLRPDRLLSNENNDRFMKQVIGKMGKLHGVKLEKLQQANLQTNQANFQS